MFRFYNTRLGSVAHTPSDQCIRASLETYGEWAHHELSVLRLLVGRGDTVFDVGANVGYHTLAFSRFVGRLGRVVAFEPNPQAFRLANLTVAVNDVQNVELHQLLVGSSSGVAALRIIDAQDNLGAVRFETAGSGPARGVTYLNRARLDDFAAMTPSLIKIDVEGAQFDVLDGCTDIIATSRPVIFLEANEDSDADAARDWFDGRGYRLVTFAAPAFNPANLCGASHDIFGGTAERGLLALPEERVEALGAKHPLLAALIGGAGDGLDWGAYPATRDWGALRPWAEVHAMNQGVATTARKSRPDLAEEHARIFLHIPKTAGTSLIDSIKPQFGNRAHEFYPDNQFAADSYDFTDLEFEPGALVYGHFQLVERFLSLHDASFLTVLRDPLDRAVSEFVHAIDRNMNTSFGERLGEWPFDYGQSTRFDLAEFMMSGRNRLFFTNTHIRYLGALGVTPVQPRHVSEVIDRLQHLHFVFATVPTLGEDVARWLDMPAPVELSHSNTRGRLRAVDLFCQETIDLLQAANAEDNELLRRLRPDAFSVAQPSNVPDKDEELRRLAAVFSRYAPARRARK